MKGYSVSDFIIIYVPILLLLFFLFCLSLVLKSEFNGLKVEQNGQIVKMKITKKTFISSSKRSSYVDLEYDTQRFTPSIGLEEFNNCNVGDSIERKYIKGINLSKGLYESNSSGQIVMCVLLMSFVVYCIYRYYCYIIMSFKGKDFVVKKAKKPR